MPSSVDMRFVTNTYCWSPSTVLSSTGRIKMDLFPASFSLNSTCKGSTYHCFLKSEMHSTYFCRLIENIVPCHLDMLYCNLVVNDFKILLFIILEYCTTDTGKIVSNIIRLLSIYCMSKAL